MISYFTVRLPSFAKIGFTFLIKVQSFSNFSKYPPIFFPNTDSISVLAVFELAINESIEKYVVYSFPNSSINKFLPSSKKREKSSKIISSCCSKEKAFFSTKISTYFATPPVNI